MKHRLQARRKESVKLEGTPKLQQARKGTNTNLQAKAKLQASLNGRSLAPMQINCKTEAYVQAGCGVRTH
jgi:hypothetical protein